MLAESELHNLSVRECGMSCQRKLSVPLITSCNRYCVILQGISIIHGRSLKRPHSNGLGMHFKPCWSTKITKILVQTEKVEDD